MNAPKWWKDGAVGSDCERIDIDHTSERQTGVVHIWIDKKNRAVFASRGVID